MKTRKLLFFTIAIYPFLLIWQGGDLTDTGFHAVYSQNFFFNLNEGNVDYRELRDQLLRIDELLTRSQIESQFIAQR